MNRQQLLEEIQRLNREENIKINSLAADGFAYQPKYSYLLSEFRHNKLKREKWHQLVRFALYDPKKKEYLYNRSLSLIRRYLKDHESFFLFKNETGSYYLPDRLADLNRLLMLYKEYFEIYLSITNYIHFDFQLRHINETIIQHGINWNKTLCKTKTLFPLSFEASTRVREFNTAENILLLLCAIWINIQSNRLLRLDFNQPLILTERLILTRIRESSEKIISNFPFYEVIESAQKYSHLLAHDNTVSELEYLSRCRFKQGLIRNRKYIDLLEWIEKYKKLNIRMPDRSSTTLLLESLKDIDVLYEVWIFFEFIDFVTNSGWKIDTKGLRENERFFEIEHSGVNIICHYEKEFNHDNHTWTVNAKPDFTFMVDDSIVGVFDAKNYDDARNNAKADAINKMLGYMTNLDADYGALIFPEYRSEEFFYPRKCDKPKYHFNLKLANYQMEPADSKSAIEILKQSLSKMFEELFRRIELKVHVHL
jgi:hypothetical protein